METIIRGTTPTVILKDLGRDISSGWTVYMTFEWDTFVNRERQKGQITKSGQSVSVTSTQVSATLTQEDTLSFPEGGIVKAQVRAYKNGEAVATDVDNEETWFRAGSVLLEEEIPLGS